MKVRIKKYYSYKWFGLLDMFIEDKLGCDWTPGAWLYNARPNNRIKIKVEAHDIFEARSSLAVINLEVLKEFRNCSSESTPFIKIEDIPEALHGYVTEDTFYNEGGFSHEGWDWILGEMIFAFEYCLDDGWLDDSKEQDRLEKRCQNGLLLYAKYFRSLWT